MEKKSWGKWFDLIYVKEFLLVHIKKNIYVCIKKGKEFGEDHRYVALFNQLPWN